jgi:hypothetical protein
LIPSAPAVSGGLKEKIMTASPGPAAPPWGGAGIVDVRGAADLLRAQPGEGGADLIAKLREYGVRPTDTPLGDGFYLNGTGIWRLHWGVHHVEAEELLARGLIEQTELEALMHGPQPRSDEPIVPLPCPHHEFLRGLFECGLLDRLVEPAGRELAIAHADDAMRGMPLKQARRFVRALHRGLGWLDDAQARGLYRAPALQLTPPRAGETTAEKYRRWLADSERLQRVGEKHATRRIAESEKVTVQAVNAGIRAAKAERDEQRRTLAKFPLP